MAQDPPETIGASDADWRASLCSAGAGSCASPVCGACEGGVTEADEPSEFSADCPLKPVEDSLTDGPGTGLGVLPGKALAASAANAPVRVTLPATNQRLVSTSLRKPALRTSDERSADDPFVDEFLGAMKAMFARQAKPELRRT